MSGVDLHHACRDQPQYIPAQVSDYAPTSDLPVQDALTLADPQLCTAYAGLAGTKLSGNIRPSVYIFRHTHNTPALSRTGTLTPLGFALPLSYGRTKRS